MEEWKVFDGYKISNFGNIIGKYGKILKFEMRNGYKRITINKKHRCVHILVALLFIGERPPNFVIDHIDRDKTNNNVSNLRYITQQQNNFNKNAKGYRIMKNGFSAQIQLNEKKYSKYFKTEVEAKNWYLEQKSILHVIPTTQSFSQSVPEDTPAVITT